jgi:hypothetical protein
MVGRGAAMADPEAGHPINQSPSVRPPSADGYRGGPGPGWLARTIRKVSVHVSVKHCDVMLLGISIKGVHAVAAGGPVGGYGVCASFPMPMPEA